MTLTMFRSLNIELESNMTKSLMFPPAQPMDPDVSASVWGPTKSKRISEATIRGIAEYFEMLDLIEESGSRTREVVVPLDVRPPSLVGIEAPDVGHQNPKISDQENAPPEDPEAGGPRWRASVDVMDDAGFQAGGRYSILHRDNLTPRIPEQAAVDDLGVRDVLPWWPQREARCLGATPPTVTLKVGRRKSRGFVSDEPLSPSSSGESTDTLLEEAEQFLTRARSKFVTLKDWDDIERCKETFKRRKRTNKPNKSCVNYS